MSSDLAFAQMKLPSKTAPGANEIRYFTSIDGLMDGNADVVLKETRQGKSVSAAVLDRNCASAAVTRAVSESGRCAMSASVNSR